MINAMKFKVKAHLLSIKQPGEAWNLKANDFYKNSVNFRHFYPTWNIHLTFFQPFLWAVGWVAALNIIRSPQKVSSIESAYINISPLSASDPQVQDFFDAFLFMENGQSMFFLYRTSSSAGFYMSLCDSRVDFGEYNTVFIQDKNIWSLF